MHRSVAVMAVVASVAMFLGAPAAAQYGAGVRDRIGQVAPATAQPGETVTFTSNSVFTPGSTVDVVLVRARQQASGTMVGDDIATTSSGAVSHAFSLPDAAAHGIYIVYADGTGAGGRVSRVVAILIVLAAPADAQAQATGSPAGRSEDGDGGDSAVLSSAQPVVPPAEVQAIQQPAEVEASLLDEALPSGSSVVFDGEQLVVVSGPHREPPTGTPAAPATTAGAFRGPLGAGLVAVAFAGGGLLTLRQRRRRT